MNKRLLIGALAAALPGLAGAAPLAFPFTGMIAPYYSYGLQQFDDGSPHFSGSGAGISAQFNLPMNLFVDGMYQWNNETVQEVPGARQRFDQARAGGGIQLFLPYSPLVLYGKVDYVHYGTHLKLNSQTVDNDNDDGTGYFGGLRMSRYGYDFYAQGGYVDLSDASGPEALVGFDVPLGRALKLFAEYRYNDYALNNSSNHVRFSDYHVGFRLPLGP